MAQQTKHQAQEENTTKTTGLPVKEMDTGLACLILIAQYHDLAVNPHQLKHEFSPSGQHFST